MRQQRYPPTCDPTSAITSIVVDSAGSGYSFAPGIAIIDGTLYDPAGLGAGSGATATATLTIQNVALDTFGSGYTTPPTVAFADPTGTGAGTTSAAPEAARPSNPDWEIIPAPMAPNLSKGSSYRW